MADLTKASGQRVIGLMSGTSLDGIDAALLETDGEAVVRPGAALTIPYGPHDRALMRAAIEDAPGVSPGGKLPHSIREAESLCSEAHARAVRALLEAAGLAAAEVGLIGFHGQTILHRPAQRRTWQIGDGALLARLTGIDVVNDFRRNDVAAGGQGAPLMPLYHAALVRSSPASEADSGGVSLAAKPSERRSTPQRAKAGGGNKTTALAQPVAVVNIGGVSNVTYISGETVLAFDTGPGNAPIDDWMHRHTGRPVDEGGALARQGRIDEAALAAMLAHPFFRRPPPKSLDRQDFGMEAVERLVPADGAATLAAFTAAAIARGAEYFPAPARTWIVCGGGRHNDFLMEQLAKRVQAKVLKSEEAGWDGDALEAQGFAYLAARSVRGLPLSLPTTTGVPHPMTGGVLHKAP